MQPMYYIGLDVHKRTIRYCVKDGSGAIHAEGTLPTRHLDLDRWMKTLPQPWTAAMEATVFTGCAGSGGRCNTIQSIASSILPEGNGSVCLESIKT